MSSILPVFILVSFLASFLIYYENNLLLNSLSLIGVKQEFFTTSDGARVSLPTVTPQLIEADLPYSPSKVFEPDDEALQFFLNPQNESKIYLSKNRYIFESELGDIYKFLDCMVSPNGSWVYDNSTEIFTFNQPLVRLPCAKSTGPSSLTFERNPALFFSWQTPSDCPIEKFSRDRFCSIMKNFRYLYLIGDSLTVQTFYNIAYLYSSSDFNQLNLTLRLQCKNNFSFPMNFIHSKHLNMDKIFLSTPEIFDHSLFLINRGAHFVHTRGLLPQLKHSLSVFQERFPNSIFVFRSSPKGLDLYDYPDKTKLDSVLPLKHPQPPINYTRLPHKFSTYNWENFRSQMLEIRKMLREEFPGILFLDVDYPDSLRIDHRTDGLHSCIPGPTTIWITFFMNLMIQLENYWKKE